MVRIECEEDLPKQNHAEEEQCRGPQAPKRPPNGLGNPHQGDSIVAMPAHDAVKSFMDTALPRFGNVRNGVVSGRSAFRRQRRKADGPLLPRYKSAAIVGKWVESRHS